MISYMRIIKFLLTCFLFFFIVGLASFMYLRFSALSTESNFFNDNLRYKFARYPAMRQILGLHFDGDAKADYLGKKYKNITIKIIAMDGLEIDRETVKSFAEKVEKITNKETKYLYYPNIKYEASISVDELRKYLEDNNSFLFSEEAVLYTFIASQNKDNNENLGLTLSENGIILFKNTLINSMRNDTMDNFDSYSVSLLLHEFGHQLGLDHNSNPDCLMNAQTEFSDRGKLLENVNDFCDYEKNQIERMVF